MDRKWDLPKVGCIAILTVATLGMGGCATTPRPTALEGQCKQLLQLSTPGAEIHSAEFHSAGPFTAPVGSVGVDPALTLPAFCRVSLTLKPTPDSEIGMEAWLPADSWNRKFLMVGNGGWSGSIPYPALAEGLNRHYAVVATDRGHRGTRGTFAFGHPEKLIDFAWRAVQDSAAKGKELTQSFYREAPRLSYWNGCSSGGGQGLQLAQRFPNEFDGIVAGAPANNWINLHAQSIAANQINLPKGLPPILGPREYDLLHRGAVAQCDGLDGLRDGEIDDPRQCQFKPAALLCKPGQDAARCLNQGQVDAATRLYAEARNPRTGEFVFPGMVAGSELNWERVVSSPWLTAIDTFALAYNNPDWDFRTFDMDQDIAVAKSASVSMLPALSPDLSAFRARGGKLILYHGWGDGGIPPENSINYYESVVAQQGGLDRTRAFARLFMVPGLGHCRGGYSLDWLTPLENWVEHGVAPEAVTAVPIASAAPPSDTPGMATTTAEARGHSTDRLAKAVCAYPGVASQGAERTQKAAPGFSCHSAPRGSRQGHGPGDLGAPLQ